MKVAGISLPRANKRLRFLFDEAIKLSSNDIVADVGADHGYLSAMLQKSNQFKKVIATDISAPSLQKAKQLFQSLNLDIECIVCDGIEAVPQATLVCICGMGGYEIIKILNQRPQAKKFVFQPVQNGIELREYLIRHRYKIVSDYVIEDKCKFYNIISVCGKGFNFYSSREKLFGRDNLKSCNQDFLNYLKNQINKLSFLEKFDINSVDRKERKNIAIKLRYYKLCKKILRRGSSI